MCISIYVCTYVCMYVEHVHETAQCTDLQTVSGSCAEWQREVALLSAVVGRGCT